MGDGDMENVTSQIERAEHANISIDLTMPHNDNDKSALITRP